MRYVMRRRELNRRSTAEYIRVLLSGEDPTFQSEELPEEESCENRLRSSFGGWKELIVDGSTSKRGLNSLSWWGRE